MIEQAQGIRLYAYLHVTKTTGKYHLRVRQYGGYNDGLKYSLRRVGTPAEWKKDTWEWDYPLTAACVSALGVVAEQHNVVVEWSAELAEYASQRLAVDNYEKQVRLAIEKIIREELEVDQYLTNTFGGVQPPMRHQQIGTNWGLRCQSLFLAWDPGLGKTRCAVDTVGNLYRNGMISGMESFWIQQQTEVVPAVTDPMTGRMLKPSFNQVVTHARWGTKGGVLVVCPKSVIGSWKNECRNWQGMQAVSITGSSAPKKRKQAGTCTHVHIVSYGSLHHVIDNEYDMIVVDEVHRCANKTEQMDRVLGLSLRSKRRMVLTGTPVANSPESVFYQMLICDHGRALGCNKQAFLDEYFVSDPDDNRFDKHIPKDGAVEKIAAAMASCTYFLRKEECLKDLPPKTHTIHWVEMSSDQLRYYNQVKDESLAYIQDKEVTIELASQRMMKLKQICQGVVKGDDGTWMNFNNGKYIELQSILLNELWNRKVVVWCSFTHEMDGISDMLSKMGVPHVRLDGSVKSDRRREEIFAAWNQDPRVKIFLVQIQISEGFTIHANECQVPCHDCIYFGITWSYTSWIQSQDRIHRIGQRFACTYRYILTTNGIDRNIYAALQHKAHNADAVHETGKDWYVKLLTDDIPGLGELAAV